MPHFILSAVGLSAVSFICNLPLGRWRVSVSRFSASWFLAVHLSIPLIVLLRVEMGLSAWFIPLSLASGLVGQWLGGSYGAWREKRGEGHDLADKA